MQYINLIMSEIYQGFNAYNILKHLVSESCSNE